MNKQLIKSSLEVIKKEINKIAFELKENNKYFVFLTRAKFLIEFIENLIK